MLLVINHAKQTMFLTTFCEKVPKPLKNIKKRNLVCNIKHMNLVLNFNRFNTIIYIQNSVVCQVSRQINYVRTTLCEKVPKTVKKHKKRNVAHNFKHMTIVFNANHLQKTIYTK